MQIYIVRIYPHVPAEERIQAVGVIEDVESGERMAFRNAGELLRLVEILAAKGAPTERFDRNR